MTSATVRGYAKGRARRAEIIDRATVLFGEVGYRGSSLREIAARCGISHPGLLHHFTTKKALLIALLEYRDELDGARFSGEPGVERLRQIVDLAADNEQRRGTVELYVVLAAEATAADHPAHDYFATRYGRALDIAAQSFDVARGHGQLRAGVDPTAAAQELIALMDGLQLQWLLDGGRTPMAALVRQHVQARLTVEL